MNCVLAIYSHVEAYPPILNALNYLSSRFDKIVVVQRNVMTSEWIYPPNVRLVPVGPFAHFSTVPLNSFIWKVASFLRFARALFLEVKRARPKWLILHDPSALLAWYLVKRLIRNTSWPKIWYHNHDVVLGHESMLSYWAFRVQSRLFPELDRFSLPSNDRKKYFPMNRFTGQYLFLPNYPDRAFYDSYFKDHGIKELIRIVYQGYIGAGHGLEEFLTLVSDGKHGRFVQITLVLKGFRDEGFVSSLRKQVSKLGIEHCVEFHELTGYAQVPEVASSCHIGIGIHMKTDVMTMTLGTASNKIYEYAALGLPVIVFDSPQFRKHLGEFQWAFFTNGTADDLKGIIQKILSNYNYYSTSARADFERNLNFAHYFELALHDL